MKKTIIRTTILSLALILISLPLVYSQIKSVVYYPEADLCIGDGTGASYGDAKTMNFGKEGILIMTNFDDNALYRSGFETWVKFNLSTLLDSIPSGQKILYAEIALKVAGNYGNGYNCYHLKNIDDWKEGDGTSSSTDNQGGLTWTTAQNFNYTNTANSTLINTNSNLGSTGTVEKFSVQQAVDYELGSSGNKSLTLRFAPTITSYDPLATDPIKWLGFYSQESPWEVILPNNVNKAAPHITFSIGPDQPKIFSDKTDFGNLDNYSTIPTGFNKWAVVSDGGQERLKITERPSPVNKTPGGLAIYNKQSFTDFDISLQAKLNKWGTSGIDPKVDFAVAFGYKNSKDYLYMLFTGEGKDGIYKVTDAGASLVGAGNTTASVSDTLYHTYRLVRKGNTVTAYVDGTVYLTETNASLVSEGMIGMGSYNDIAFFDDFKEASATNAAKNLIENAFKVYPNPAGDHLYFNSEIPISKLRISDMLGKEILTQTTANSGLTEINLSQLNNGVYFITCYGKNGNVYTQKFIKQ